MRCRAYPKGISGRRAIAFFAALIAAPVLIAWAALQRRAEAPCERPRVNSDALRAALSVRLRVCPSGHDHGSRYASGGVEWCGDCGMAVGAIGGVS